MYSRRLDRKRSSTQSLLHQQRAQNECVSRRHRKLSEAIAAPRLLKTSDFLLINIGGKSFKVSNVALNLFPNSLLKKFADADHFSRLEMCHSYLSDCREYYFERSPVLFDIAFGAYREGFVHIPPDQCAHAILDELDYWRIDLASVRLCCASSYVKALITQRLKPPDPEDMLAEIRHQVQNEFSGQFLRGVRRPLWELLEIPTSSKFAMVFMIASVFFVVLTMVVLVLGSLEPFQIHTVSQSNHTNRTMIESIPALNVADAVCVGWFTVEYLLRLFAAPKRWIYVKGPLSIIDVLAIVPYFAEVALDSSGITLEEMHNFRRSIVLIRILRLLRLLRVLRVLKVARYSKGFQTMGQALQRSWHELTLLIMFIMTTNLIFSTAMYFIECDDPNTFFTSIPEAAWWCIITMTTVGYGDVYPVTIQGKVLASMVSISGIILLAFPISVIVENFNQAYYDVHSKEKAEEKSQTSGSQHLFPPPAGLQLLEVKTEESSDAKNNNNDM